MMSACASSDIKPIAYPTVKLHNLQLVDYSLSEQNYEIQIQIDNPNAFPLPLNKVDYQLTLNDAVFAKGVNQEPVMIPANQSEIIKLQVKGNLIGLYEQARSFGESIFGGDFSRELDYGLKGNLSFVEGLLNMPYDYSGKLSIRSIIDNQL